MYPAEASRSTHSISNDIADFTSLSRLHSFRLSNSLDGKKYIDAFASSAFELCESQSRSAHFRADSYCDHGRTLVQLLFFRRGDHSAIARRPAGVTLPQSQLSVTHFRQT